MKPFKNKSRRRNFGQTGRRDYGGSGRQEYGKPARRDYGGGGRTFGRPAMHQATCAKCGQQCEVPFKPTGDKPVYCRECYKKDGNNGLKEGTSQITRELEKVNKKLDKILDALNAG
jgi:CxxC-x17-CxxC domain-containing protein